MAENNTSDFENLFKLNELKDIIILVAEDEDSSFRYLEKLLNESGINVLRAINGQEAIDLTLSNPQINLVIMDIKMPVMNGIEASREIRKFKPSLPIIATTSFTMPGDKQVFIDAGCNDYLPKPIKLQELLELMKKYI